MDVLDQLSEKGLQRVEKFGHTLESWSLTDWGCAVAGETGELCNVLKKVHRGDYTLEQANERKLIANEAADVVIYLNLLCQRAGISLKEAIVEKFNSKSDEIGSSIKLSL